MHKSVQSDQRIDLVRFLSLFLLSPVLLAEAVVLGIRDDVVSLPYVPLVPIFCCHYERLNSSHAPSGVIGFVRL